MTILTAGYMVSRGLSKSGSREPYYDEESPRRTDRHEATSHRDSPLHRRRQARRAGATTLRTLERGGLRVDELASVRVAAQLDLQQADCRGARAFSPARRRTTTSRFARVRTGIYVRRVRPSRGDRQSLRQAGRLLTRSAGR